MFLTESLSFKRRLTHTRQLEKYKLFLKPKGEIYFKTDDDNLFRVIYETASIAEQRFYGTKEECENYIRIINTCNNVTRQYILKYVRCQKDLLVALN